MKKIAAILLVVLMSLAVLAGCGSTPSNTGTTSGSTTGSSTTGGTSAKTTFGLTPFKDPQTLRIGFFTGSPLSYPYLFAEKLGYFKELNINVEFVPFTNGPAMLEASSEWDIGSMGEGGLATSLKKGFKIIDINDYEQNLALFARPGSPLAKDPKNPANWKGTTWVYPAGTTAQAVLVNALKNVGLTLKDVKSVNMDVANALTGFKGGTGDGLGVWNAVAFNAEDAGLVRITDAGQLGFKSPCGTVVTDQTLQQKKELIETAVALFHFTVGWVNASDANKKQAAQWYLEDCTDEGLKVDQSIATRVMDWYRGPTMSQYIDLFTTKSPDDAKLYTKRDLLQAEKDILVGLDFFISQGNYSNDDRNNFLDKNQVDPTIALGVKDMLDKQGIKY